MVRLIQDGMDSRLAMPKRLNDRFVGFSLVGSKPGDEMMNTAYVDTRAPTEASVERQARSTAQLARPQSTTSLSRTLNRVTSAKQRGDIAVIN